VQSQKLRVLWFLVMFAALVILANVDVLPDTVVAFASDVSRWCLMIAISALGVKTSLVRFAKVRPSYGLIHLAETLFLLLIALLFVMCVGV